MSVDRSRVDHACVAPDFIEQPIARLHATGSSHQHREQLVDGNPFLSHIGYHCTDEEAQAKIKELAASGIGIAQEVWTYSHTNPAIAGKRQYHYIVFDSIDAFGFDLKLIVRKDINNEEAAI